MTAREHEHIEKLLRRFKRKIEAAGILKEIRRRQYFLKPSVRKKQKQAEAAKRRRRIASRMQQQLKRSW